MRPPPKPSLTEIVRRTRPDLTFAGTARTTAFAPPFGEAAVGEDFPGTVSAKLQPHLGGMANESRTVSFRPVAFTLCNCGARFSVNSAPQRGYRPDVEGARRGFGARSIPLRKAPATGRARDQLLDASRTRSDARTSHRSRAEALDHSTSDPCNVEEHCERGGNSDRVVLAERDADPVWTVRRSESAPARVGGRHRAAELPAEEGRSGVGRRDECHLRAGRERRGARWRAGDPARLARDAAGAVPARITRTLERREARDERQVASSD